MDEKPKRRWTTCSIRGLLGGIAIAAILFWLGTNLSWMHARWYAIEKQQLRAEGERRAPWPLFLFGAKGFERILLDYEPKQPGGGRLQIEELFPESDLVVSPGKQLIPVTGKKLRSLRPPRQPTK